MTIAAERVAKCKEIAEAYGPALTKGVSEGDLSSFRE